MYTSWHRLLRKGILSATASENNKDSQKFTNNVGRDSVRIELWFVHYLNSSFSSDNQWATIFDGYGILAHSYPSFVLEFFTNAESKLTVKYVMRSTWGDRYMKSFWRGIFSDTVWKRISYNYSTNFADVQVIADLANDWRMQCYDHPGMLMVTDTCFRMCTDQICLIEVCLFSLCETIGLLHSEFVALKTHQRTYLLTAQTDFRALIWIS